MIVRQDGTDFLLIRQHDHALLAGELVGRVGNRRFAPPLPLGPMLAAVGQHDCAWSIHDDYPTIIDGRPRHVFEMTQDPMLQIWQESVDRVVAIDPYAGLLTALHAMNLAGHLKREEDGSPAGRQRTFRGNQFLHRQIELQETLRGRLGMRTDLPLRRGLAESGRSSEEDLLRCNFFLLQLLDQISLVLCFDRLVFETVEPVCARPGSEPLAIRITQDVPGRYQVRPWPFDSEQIELQIPAKRIEDRVYADDADLCAAYAAASTEMITTILHGGFGQFARGRGTVPPKFEQ